MGIDVIAAYSLLCDSLQAWEGEEESVKEEHAEHIDALSLFVDENADAYLAACRERGIPAEPDRSRTFMIVDSDLRRYYGIPHEPVAAARAGVVALRFARDCFKAAGASKTVGRVRLALTSGGGAVRHASGKAVR